MKFKPLVVGETTWSCRHAAIWPPGRGVLLQESIEDQLDNGEITRLEYEQLRTWQKVCGLSVMHEDKCLSCPHVLRDGVLAHPEAKVPAAFANRGLYRPRKKK